MIQVQESKSMRVSITMVMIARTILSTNQHQNEAQNDFVMMFAMKLYQCSSPISTSNQQLHLSVHITESHHNDEVGRQKSKTAAKVGS
jgi:hypothetical protein